MTNRRSHLSRSLFNRIGPKIRIAELSPRALALTHFKCHATPLPALPPETKAVDTDATGQVPVAARR